MPWAKKTASLPWVPPLFSPLHSNFFPFVGNRLSQPQPNFPLASLTFTKELLLSTDLVCHRHGVRMELQTARVIQGRGNNSRIYHCGDGFHYIVRERRRTRLRLKCRLRGRGCPGTAAVSRETGQLRHLNPHNHPPDMLYEEELAVRRALIQDSALDMSGKTTRCILEEMRVRIRNPALAMRFTRVRMCSALYAARNAGYPPIPSSLLYLGVLLGLPGLRPMCKTIDGTDYMFQGAIGNELQKTVAVVFASGRMLQLLSRKESIHVDGTFRKRPKKPKVIQIFNIVFKHGDIIIGAVRILMTKRTRQAYVVVFKYLKQITVNFNPLRLHCDFELAHMRAFQAEFPLCRVVGCLWHYGVCIGKKARALGLSQHSKENNLIMQFISCMCAIPLLPQHLLGQGLLALWDEVVLSGWSSELGPLFVYFETTWVPRFGELSVFGDADRTNNCSESDNRMLGNAVPQNFPNIWNLIRGFVILEFSAWCDVLAVDEMRPVAPSRRASAVANDRKVRLASQMLRNNDATPVQFLEKVSYAAQSAARYGLRIDNFVGDDSEDSDSESGEDNPSSASEQSDSDSAAA